MQPRRLLLIRHAEAADGAVDADRPLTAWGEQCAAAIGSWLTQADLVPELVLVSPARRAAQTWEHANTKLLSGAEPRTDPRIYENTVAKLLAAIRESPEDAQTVAVVGHNPSIGQLSAALDDGRGAPEDRHALARGFPAGCVAVFVLPEAFSRIAPGRATLSEFTVPGD